MLKTIYRILFTMSLTGTILYAATNMCGCGRTEEPNQESKSMAVVMSNCSNFPSLTEQSVQPIYKEMEDTYYDGTFSGGGSISIVTTEGDPQVYSVSIDSLNDGISDSKRRSESEIMVKSIIKDAVSLMPVSEEIDLLKAINLAVQSVNSDDTCKKTILIIANGTSTAGVCNMTEGYLLDSAESVAEQLISTHSINDLSGVTVDWIGMGATASNGTQTISDSNRHDLEAFWKTVLLKAGAQDVIFESDVISGTCPENLPKVSEVVFPEVVLNVSDSIPEDSQVVKLDSIKFQGDSNAFLDWEVALDSLQLAADFLTKNQTKEYLVVGTTASVNGGDGTWLSQMRAQACVEELISLGVSEDRLIAVGLGNLPWSMRTFPDDEGYGLSAEQLENNRAANRAVYIVDAKSEIGKEVLALIS